MSISPGKIGELIKAYLVKKKYDIPIYQTSAVILAERMIEFISLLILFGFGIIIYSQTYLIFFLMLIFFFLVIIVLTKNKSLRNKLKAVFEKFAYTKSKIEDISKFKNSLSKLFSPRIFASTLIVSFIAWYFEILAFNQLISDLGKEGTLFFAIFAYTGSIIAGAISMIPGGIFTTEFSLIYFISDISIKNNEAVLITLIIRFATLWFSVLIGIISYLLFVRCIKKRNS